MDGTAVAFAGKSCNFSRVRIGALFDEIIGLLQAEIDSLQMSSDFIQGGGEGLGGVGGGACMSTAQIMTPAISIFASQCTYLTDFRPMYCVEEIILFCPLLPQPLFALIHFAANRELVTAVD